MTIEEITQVKLTKMLCSTCPGMLTTRKHTEKQLFGLKRQYIYLAQKSLSSSTPFINDLKSDHREDSLQGVNIFR